MRWSEAAVVLALALVAGCGEDPPAEKPRIPVVSGPVVQHTDAGAGTAFGDATFACCDSEAATAVVGAYVGLGEALAADDLAGARERAGALGAALAQATTQPGVGDADRASLEKMAALVDRLGTQAELDGAREEFLDLADPMLAFAQAHAGGGLPVAVAFCPMKPGRWLQVKGTIANPYYGAQMLTCGVFEKAGAEKVGAEKAGAGNP